MVLGPFKAHTLPIAFSFSAHANAIYADNRRGKTTIRDGIVFCLYGTDPAGSNIGLEKLFNDAQKEEYHRIPAGLEATFNEWAQYRGGTFIEKLEAFRREHQLYSEQPIIDTAVWFTGIDGKEHVISRRRTFKGSSSLKLGGKSVSNKDLAEVLPDKDLFLSVFVNGYFFALSEKKRRDLLRKYMKGVDWRDILCTRAPESEHVDALLVLNGVDAAMQHAKDTHLAQVRRVHELEARAKVLREEIASIQTGQASATTDVAKTKVGALEQSVKNTGDWKVALRELDATNAERAARNTNIEQERENVKQTNARNEARVKEIDKYLTDHKDIAEPVNGAEQLRQQLNAIVVGQVTLPPRPERPSIVFEQAPIAGSLQRCPECGTNLEAYMAEELTRVSSANEARKKRADEDYTEACSVWETECKAISTEHTTKNAAAFKQREELQATIDAAQVAYNDQLRDYHRVTAQCTSLAKERVGIDATIEDPQTLPLLPLPDGSPYKSAAEAHTKLISIEAELFTAREELQAVTSRVSAAQATAKMYDDKRAEIDKLPDQIVAARNLKGTLEILRGVVEELPTHIVRRQMEDVQEHIPNIAISYYKEVKETGEFKQELQFFFKDTPYAVLSNSERLTVGIELGTLLNLLSKQGVPIFVDNAEAMTKLPKALGKQQYFATYVSKDHKDITIAGR
jgi:hypothetical protein